jgi:hypothetical protein
MPLLCPDIFLFAALSKIVMRSRLFSITQRHLVATVAKLCHLNNAMTFWRNISPPSSGLKNKPSKTQHEAGSKQTLEITGDGGNMFLKNIG